MSYKTSILFLCLSFIFLNAFPQKYNLEVSSEAYSQLTDANIAEFTAGDAGTAMLTEEIPLGFSFNYFQTSFTTLKISSSGYITFDVEASAVTRLSLDNAPLIVAPLWHQGHQVLAPRVTYKTEGVPGSMVFTCEWEGARFSFDDLIYVADPQANFQVKLYEADHSIKFSYRKEASGTEHIGFLTGLSGPEPHQFYALVKGTSEHYFAVKGNYPYGPSYPQHEQVFLFTPSIEQEIAPTVQASGLEAFSVKNDRVHLAYDRGNGQYRSLFIKAITEPEVFSPEDRTHYVSSDSIGILPPDASGWYCVVNADRSSGSLISVYGVVPGATYQVVVIEYNGVAGNQTYLAEQSAANSITVTIPLVEAPQIPVPPLQALYVGRTSYRARVAVGTDKVIVFMKEGTDIETANPVDGTTYSPNSQFGSGTQIGTSGWYCVAKSNLAFEFSFNGLEPGKSYVVNILEYDGPAGYEKYNRAYYTTHVSLPPSYGSTKQVSNVDVFTTPAEVTPLNEYTFSASTGTFTPFTNGTQVFGLADEGVSTPIPIGFPFHFYGVAYENLWLTSVGHLSFNALAQNFLYHNRGFDHECNVEWTVLRPCITPIGAELNGLDNGSVRYISTGIPGERVFTVQYLNYGTGLSPSKKQVSYQVRLFEQDNHIEFIYRRETASPAVYRATIGLAHNDMGSKVRLDNSGANPTINQGSGSLSTPPVTGQIYRFDPVKLLQSLTFESLPQNITFGDGPFDLTATATSGLDVSFISSDTTVARVTGNILSITGGGQATISAVQQGNAVYMTSTETQQVEVNKAAQTIPFPPIPQTSYGNAPFELEQLSSADLPIEYHSADTSVARVTQNVVTIVGAGSTVITASQSGNKSFHSATSVNRELIVAKGSQFINFDLISSATFGETIALRASSSSGLPVVFSSTDPEIAAVSNDSLTIIGVGTFTIIATQPGNANYLPADDIQQTVLAEKATQSIEFELASDWAYGDSIQVPSTSSSGLPVTFESSDTAIAVVHHNIIYLCGVGIVSITATQGGNENYFDVEVAKTLVVKKKDQSITFAFADPDVDVDTFDLAATSSSALPVTFSSSNENVIIVNGTQAVVTGAGKTLITATQGGNEFYNTVSDGREVKVVRSQTISFPQIADVSVTDEPFLLHATSSAGLGVSYTSSFDNVVIEDNRVTIVKPGPVTIRATQSGNEYYLAANVVSRTFCIRPPTPSISNEENTLMLTSDSQIDNQWYRDGVQIEGATGISYEVSMSGSYTVTTRVGNCESDPSHTITVLITAGEQAAENDRIYPNPVKNFFIVDLPPHHSDNTTVRLYDMRGQCIRSWKGTRFPLDVTSLPSGKYIVEINCAGTRVLRSLVKE